MWQERSTLPSETADGKPPATVTDGKTPGTAVVVDGKLKIGDDLELSEEDIRGLLERRGLEESRKATMPAEPSGYTLDLPEDFPMPDDVRFEWKADDPVLGPMIARAKEFAFANGLDQSGFSKMMGLYAATQLHEAKAISDWQAREVQTLGAAGSVRVDAVKQFLRGHLGEAPAKSLIDGMHTAAQISAYESLMKKFTSQGAASFSQIGRDNTPKGRVSDEEYAAMSPGQRLDYARSFDQRQFHNPR
jgi:hypothetical protein